LEDEELVKKKPFLLVEKQSPYKERKRKKLTYENNDHLSFPVKRLPKPTLVPRINYAVVFHEINT
jgi:hypothetical protein